MAPDWCAKLWALAPPDRHVKRSSTWLVQSPVDFWIVSRMAGRRSRILVVDDERALTDAIERTLAPEHDVIVVNSARQALELAQRDGRFDAILSDLMMPAMSGMELYEQLRQARPEQADRMIFMSGGACTPEVAAFLASEVRPTIQKPFRAAVLRETIRQVLMDVHEVE